MNKILYRNIAFLAFVLAAGCSSAGGGENPQILIKTTLGDIKVILYNDTPVHRGNFLKLVNSGFYDGISFHRVINGFMIQAGDPATRSVPIDKGQDSLFTHTIPAEFTKLHFHKKGALAAAREGNNVNPEMRSSGTQFYIVQGAKLTDEDLARQEERINNNIKQAMFNKLMFQVADSARKSGKTMSDAEVQGEASLRMFQFLTSLGSYKIPDDQREVYKTSGGVPRLDQTYTVFGEVIEGLEVVDAIAAVQTDPSDKPMTDVKILKMKILSK
jgi:cyclophilin family peptidyl-prolyl cis-trans isomerase